MPSRHFKLHSAAYVILKRQNRILLARRCNTGYQDGNYGFVSGHLDGDEPASAAAIREAKEEIGIDIKAKDLVLTHIMHRHSPEQGKDFEYIDFFFIADRWQGEPQIMEPEKCDQLAWFDPHQLPDNVVTYIKDVLNYIKQGQAFSEYGWPS